MKFCYTHSEVWHFRIKYPKVALNHSFLMHPFSTPWKHQKTFQGIEKGCIGNESVKESFPFYPFLLEDPSVKFQFFNGTFWTPIETFLNEFMSFQKTTLSHILLEQYFYIKMFSWRDDLCSTFKLTETPENR